MNENADAMNDNAEAMNHSAEATSLSDREARKWAMLCHLSAFTILIGVPFGNILGPLIAWMIKRDEYPLVDDQGKEALNFQISMTMYSCVCGILFFLIVPIAVALALGVFGIVVTIIAALQANKGEYYRYPMTIRLIK